MSWDCPLCSCKDNLDQIPRCACCKKARPGDPSELQKFVLEKIIKLEHLAGRHMGLFVSGEERIRLKAEADELRAEIIRMID